MLHGGVQLGVEADSLNCSILGTDVGVDDPEFELFVKGVVTEMTVKAGQKCTAIRRVIVPAAIADQVVAAISARLAKITVGHPTSEGVRMGALASLAQRDEVRKAVQALRASAEIVFGNPDVVEVVDARPRDRRLHVAGAAACPPRCQRAPRHRALRSGRDRHHLRPTSTTRSRWRPAARAASSARSSPTTPPWRAR